MAEAKDITDAEFETAVLERSKEIPVLIDLWAPWCGPCRQLGPVLEQIATERADEFELVKLNVDENPQVAAALNARSIPLVVAFRDGKAVSQFMGAQPAGQINAFIDGLAPTPAEQELAAAEAALSADEVATAESHLRAALELDPRYEDAALMLASVLTHSDRHEEGLALLERFPSTGHDAIANMKAEIRLRQSGNSDINGLVAQVTATPEDLDARIQLGQALGAAGRHEEALETLLEAVRQSPTHDDGAARRAMVDLFSVIGGASPLVKDYRRKLSTLLH